ncbi:SDR family NAD(P)-dependent oxidoreductase [Amycolatopsis sp. GM8]|uniref:SDR family oxidoreductase n=1 Tax=Amycolatopsis sp. GM8 TaxID=2896530 RepID=UPI001F36ED5D|nr:SDR family NAD(P)-dependent oxidoreductase [Amycolatopsis sp. GM8]
MSSDEPRIALITGAGSGLGAAAADRLAEDGHLIVAADLDPAAAQKTADRVLAAGGRAECGQVDVSDAGAVADLVRGIGERHGRLDIVVCSAGISHRPGPTAELDPEIWQRVLAVNLTGTFLTCRAAVPLMLRNEYGRIVLLSSIAGKEGNAGHAAYSASKGGVIAFAKALGKELATTGVLVNAVAPAVIETPMVTRGNQDLVRAMAAKIPMNRLGRADEVAELIAWLGSDACSFSTGAVYDISGGRATY